MHSSGAWWRPWPSSQGESDVFAEVFYSLLQSVVLTCFKKCLPKDQSPLPEWLLVALTSTVNFHYIPSSWLTRPTAIWIQTKQSMPSPGPPCCPLPPGPEEHTRENAIHCTPQAHPQAQRPVIQHCNNEEIAYREEVRTLTSCCQDNNLHLCVSKRRTTVERVRSFFFLLWLRRHSVDSRTLCKFYWCKIESTVTGCITAKLHSTSGPSCHPRMTSKCSSAGRRPTETPVTPPTNSSACCCRADDTAPGRHHQAQWQLHPAGHDTFICSPAKAPPAYLSGY